MKWKRLKKKYLRYITPFWIKDNLILDRYFHWCKVFDEKYELLVQDKFTYKNAEELDKYLNEIESIQRLERRIFKLLTDRLKFIK